MSAEEGCRTWTCSDCAHDGDEVGHCAECGSELTYPNTRLCSDCLRAMISEIVKD